MLQRLLPMSGHTRGNRSAVTCELKCGSACAQEVPNPSGNGTFRQVAEQVLSRRAALGAGGGLAAAVVLSACAGPQTGIDAAGTVPAGGAGGGGTLDFEAIAPVIRTKDTMTVPAGYTWATLIRWGDPLFEDSEEFDIEHQTGASQAGQFGYNNDFLAVFPDEGGLTGILVANHEYTNEAIMFAPEYIASNTQDVVDAGPAAHGMSVVELRREATGTRWQHVRGGRRDRRITGTTEVTVTGPAAGHELLQTAADPTGARVLGTLGNCSGGVTPWGTVLSGEENFHPYFRGSGTEDQARYLITRAATVRGWEDVHERFDLTVEGSANEAHRFGWIVEVDPQDPSSAPVKRTMLGRFKHEAGSAVVTGDGSVAVYSGDDERHEYLYKFVSAQTMREGDTAHNMTLLDTGTLYVARFTGDSPEAEIDGTGALPSDGAFDGAGEWIALTSDTESFVDGMSVAEVLVFTRQAADVAGATRMDRPEDVQASPVSGKVYASLTNNTLRTRVDEANPVVGNRDGHVLEITEADGDSAATTFGWSILLMAGDPATSTSPYFAGYPAEKVSPIFCPDNLAFDTAGNLWICTDGQPKTIGYADALHRVVLEGDERGRVEQFLAVPRDAETCGPVIDDQDGSVFVNVQHPGEGGTWDRHTSMWPDRLSRSGPLQVGDAVAAPRPSVVQVTATAG